MFKLLGSISVVMFILASAFQARKSVRDGHSRGVSHGSIWTLIFGFTFMTMYVIREVGWDLLLISSYLGQLISWLVIARYKYIERD